MSDAFSAATGSAKKPSGEPTTATEPESTPEAPLETASAPTTRNERVMLALRQAAVVALIMFVAGAVVDRLRPDEATAREVFTTPFLWAAVLWFVVLLFHAVAFERNRLRELEGRPLLVAAAVGLLIFVIGIVGFDAGAAGRRILYLGSNAVGATVFWWAVCSLIWLAVDAVRTDSD